MRNGFVGCIAGVCALAFAASGTAFARAGDRTMDETYPVATALCVRAHASTLPTRLVANRAGAIAACNTLENAFGPLVIAVDQAEATYLSTVAAQRSLVATACTRPVADPAACTSARATRTGVDGLALTTRHTAVGQFHSSIKANRDTFWTAIQGLRSTTS